MPLKLLLTDEEIRKALNRFKVTHDSLDYEGARKVAKAQAKKFMEELRKRAEVEHEHCDDSCSHRGVSIWFDIYDWQALRDEV